MGLQCVLKLWVPGIEELTYSRAAKEPAQYIILLYPGMPTLEAVVLEEARDVMKLSQMMRLGLCAGVLGTLATVISISGQGMPAAKAVALARRHIPVRIHQRRENQQYDSYNWSGYAVSGSSGAVTDAKGSWIVPTANCTTTPTGYSAFWVGIDGFSSDSVEQTGTDSDCVSLTGKNGTPTYYAWFEFYPNPSYEIQFSHGIQPGDLMTAEVTYAGQTTGAGHRGPGAQFTVTITDVTKGETYTVTSTAPSANESSAEWIAEAPCCGKANSVLPLSDFSTVQFNSGAATVQGAKRAIASFGSNVQEITMVDQAAPHSVKAQPVSVSGGAFFVSWVSPGP